ncbi:MAG: winged helix-turn-helix domain-containing protein, partial [Alphaproteobacteria bacterium]|nr:winged helix-turn-helix domain-containing protein [Alphaproteobacteria bacterium]
LGLRVEVPPERYDFGDYRYDRTKKTLYCGDRVVRLTTAESSLLVWLVDHLGQPQSREILRSVIEGSVTEGAGAGEEERSGEDLASSPTRAVDVHVTRLRRKLEADPKLPRYLQTVWGKGYLLQSD